MSSSRTLQITYVGMKSQDVPIKSGTIKVMMKSDSEVLQEVVVTGMQKMDKRLFTGATKQLNADNVKLDGLPDISRGLEGRAAGDRKSTRLNSSHYQQSRMPSSA